MNNTGFPFRLLLIFSVGLLSSMIINYLQVVEVKSELFGIYFELLVRIYSGES